MNPTTDADDLQYAVDAVFRAAHGAETHGFASAGIAVIGFAEELKVRGWTWNPQAGHGQTLRCVRPRPVAATGTRTQEQERENDRAWSAERDKLVDIIREEFAAGTAVFWQHGKGWIAGTVVRSADHVSCDVTVKNNATGKERSMDARLLYLQVPGNQPAD